eukprot:10956-Heterococcus_DN1.PRE.4
MCVYSIESIGVCVSVARTTAQQRYGNAQSTRLCTNGAYQSDSSFWKSPSKASAQLLYRANTRSYKALQNRYYYAMITAP